MLNCPARLSVPLLALLLVMPAGCLLPADFFLAADYAHTADRVYAPRSPTCHVAVFSVKKPAKAFIALGIARTDASDLSDQIASLRKKACAVGGDAIVLLDSRPTTSVSSDSDGKVSSSTAVHTTATIIRWVKS